MKNYKPTVEVSVGNPAKEGEEYLIFYETGKKIAYRVRVKEAYFGYDNDNNFVIKGKGFYSDSSSFNVKADTIQTDSTTNIETTINKTINSDTVDVNVISDFNIRAKKLILSCEDIMLDGRTMIGDLTTLQKESGGDKTEEIYEYDSVMTVNKFINFYEKKFIPFFNWVVSSFNEYNKHTHGIAPTEKPVIGDKNKSGKVKASELTDLQTSQNLKVI